MASAPALRASDLHPALVAKFRLLQKGLKKSRGCRLYPRPTGGHYAHVDVQVDNVRHRELGHRVAFVLHHRDLEEGEFVLHSCDTPLCWNPEHLWAGSAQDNSDDMKAKKRQSLGPKGAAAINAAKTHCIRGHQNWGVQKGGRKCLTCERDYHREYQRKVRRDRPT